MLFRSELKACCESLNIYLFLGVEITTQEEVHVVALLPNLEVCRQMQEFIDTHIMRLPYSPDLLGDQIWVDSEEQIAGEVKWYLNAPLNRSLEQVVAVIHEFDGLAVAAHIDRSSYSIGSQLGFVPPKLCLDAIEYQNEKRYDAMCLLQPELKIMSKYTASDAHHIDQIGSRKAILELKSLSFKELVKAFHQQGERCIKPYDPHFL